MPMGSLQPISLWAAYSQSAAHRLPHSSVKQMALWWVLRTSSNRDEFSSFHRVMVRLSRVTVSVRIADEFRMPVPNDG